MIPSARWFPTTIQERAAWCANFKVQFPTVSASLNLSAFDGQVADDMNVYEYLADIFNQIKAYDESMRQYRKIITEGDVGDVTPAFPANTNFALPKIVTTGIFERLDKLRTKILAADSYTDEIGALLQILPKSPDSISPSDVQPTINTQAAQTGYLFAVTVSGRADADMWDVLILRKGASGWQSAKTAVGKSVDVTIQPTTPGESEQIQVRTQLKKNNQNYGQPSDIVYVTVNP